MPIDLSGLLNGSALFGAGAEDPNKAAMQALAAQLLMGSGYSPQRTSFGQQIGAGLQAGAAAKSDAIQNAQKNEFMRAQLQSMLARQQEQSRTHVVGNALVDDTGKVIYQSEGLDNTYGRINPGDYDPSSLSKFQQTGNYADLKRIWAPPNPTVVQMGGAPNLVQGDRNTGGVSRITPLSTLPNEIDAATRKAAAEAEAKATGTIIGETKGGIDKKAMAAQNVNDILDVADPLIDLSTGSSVGAAADKIAATFGKSLSGAEAASQLQILQSALMFAQPRMEGPQGVLDVQLYEKAAGQIGDPTVPAGIKKAAIRTIRALQSKYKDQAKRVGSQADGQPSDEDLLRKYGGE
jgi:hypothetical protein